MNTTKIVRGPVILFALLLFWGCPGPITDFTGDAPPTYSVDSDHFYRNLVPLNVKGVVYVPFLPGYVPWDMELSTSLDAEMQERIETDILDIVNMGANTIRFWGAPEYCYEVVSQYNSLNILQTIWLDSEAADYQDFYFKEDAKTYIRAVIDRIHYAYGGETPPILAYLIGNEFSEASILATDFYHPHIDYYSGTYISTDSSITATEACLAELADFIKLYQSNTYGTVPLVSYANDIRTAHIIDTPFLDFRSHNAYSYAVEYYGHFIPGSTSGNIFQGWVEYLKLQYPNVPLLITETGLSTCPGAVHVGPPNYGYGGNTLAEQADGILQNLDDIATAVLPIAGVVIHEYLDAWWKFDLVDSYTHDPDDIEEWFGLTRIIDDSGVYRTEHKTAYHSIAYRWRTDSP